MGLNRHFTIELSVIFCLLCLVIMSSCTSSREMVLFKHVPNDTLLTEVIRENKQPPIHSGDFLTITVSSLSPANTALYNTAPNMEDGVSGYRVNDSGYIKFIKLGNIHVAGKSRNELEDTLANALQPYLSETVVTVDFQNRHVTLMGAAGPTVLPLKKGMTLLEALAAGGGVKNGRTDNVLIIREQDSGKVFKRLDLRDASIFYSPYFYMQPDDVAYVEPYKKKENDIPRIIAYVTSGITFVILILDRILK